MRLLFICFFIMTLLYACSPAEEFTQTNDEDMSGESPRLVTIASDVSKEDTMFTENPELFFSKNFTQTLSRDIYPDDILTIRYDLKRMNHCEMGGRDFLQSLTGFYQVDEQAPESFEYIPSYSTSDRPQEAKIKVPQGKQISFWFYSVDTNGCEAWDSNFDQNYTIPITIQDASSHHEVSVITFEADGDMTQSHVLRSGSKMMVRFDIKRLNQCESVQNQMPQWGIMGHFKTEISEEEIFSVTENLDGELRTLDVELEVPNGSILYMWFTATNRYGCFQEDQGASLDIQ